MKSVESPLRLLVLAASQYQVAVIEAAKRLGYFVITVDNVPENPGHKLADRSYFVSTTDIEAVLAIARAEQIAGVIAACTDVAVPTAAAVSQALGLTGPSADCAEIVCNKLNFRNFQKANNLRAPKHFAVDDIAGLENIPPDGTVWISKPAMSSGSKGVFIARNEQELVSFYHESRRYSLNGRVVVEQFIEGRQGTAEGFLLDGRIRALYVFDRQTAPPPYSATWGHIVPSQFPDNALSDLSAQLAVCFAALGYTDGPFDCDFVVDEAGRVYLLEIATRIGGNSITRLLTHAYQFPIIDYALRVAVGQPVDCTQQGLLQPTAIVILGVLQKGRLAIDIEAYRRLQTADWVRYLQLDLDPGAAVEPFINGRHRLGEAVVVADSNEGLQQHIHRLKDQLALRVVQEDLYEID